MRTTVSIDDALLARAKKRAAERGLTLSGYVDESLREHLSSRPRTDSVTLPVHESARLMPAIDPSSNRSLYDALDADGSVA